MINSRMNAIIVFFAALTWSNLAIADEDLPGLVAHIHDGIHFLCGLLYGHDNHPDLLAASASTPQRFCAYASHPVDDMGALCHRFFGDNPPSQASGRIQGLCAKLQQFTKHVPSRLNLPDLSASQLRPLGDGLGLNPSPLSKLPDHLGDGPGFNPSLLSPHHLGDSLGLNPSLPSKSPDHLRGGPGLNPTGTVPERRTQPPAAAQRRTPY